MALDKTPGGSRPADFHGRRPDTSDTPDTGPGTGHRTGWDRAPDRIGPDRTTDQSKSTKSILRLTYRSIYRSSYLFIDLSIDPSIDLSKRNDFPVGLTPQTSMSVMVAMRMIVMMTPIPIHGPTMQESDLHQNLPSAEERRRARPAHGEWHPPRVGAGKAWRNRSCAGTPTSCLAHSQTISIGPAASQPPRTLPMGVRYKRTRNRVPGIRGCKAFTWFNSRFI